MFLAFCGGGLRERERKREGERETLQVKGKLVLWGSQ